LIQRTPALYARTRTVGRLGSELTGPGQARLVLSGWPGASERNLRSLGVGIQVVLELTGRRGAHFSIVRTVDGGVFHFTWAP
jgi:hypothetical protein